jgi:hypothetical protein
MCTDCWLAGQQLNGPRWSFVWRASVERARHDLSMARPTAWVRVLDGADLSG